MSGCETGHNAQPLFTTSPSAPSGLKRRVLFSLWYTMYSHLPKTWQKLKAAMIQMVKISTMFGSPSVISEALILPYSCGGESAVSEFLFRNCWLSSITSNRLCPLSLIFIGNSWFKLAPCLRKLQHQSAFLTSVCIRSGTTGLSHLQPRCQALSERAGPLTFLWRSKSSVHRQCAYTSLSVSISPAVKYKPSQNITGTNKEQEHLMYDSLLRLSGMNW